jgi:hypothetical protein
MRRTVLGAGLVLVLAITAGCSTPVVTGDADYILTEGVIDGPNRLDISGPTTLHATNIGEYSHTLVVTDDRGQVLAATGLIPSGTEATLEVDLSPGVYVFSCRIVAEDDEGVLIDHYEQGMHLTVDVID